MKSLLTTLLALVIIVLPAQSQVADGQFTASFDGTTFAVTMELQGNPVHELATSTLRFTYNQAGLSFPASPAKGTDYVISAYDGAGGSGEFYGSTVTNNSGELSVNIVLFSPTGTDLPSSWTPVVTFYFDILDTFESSNLVWELIEVFKVPGLTADQYANGTFAPLNIPLDASLPVELAAFNSRVDGNDVVLSWGATGAVEGSSFEVQSRTATDTWSALGAVAKSQSDGYSFRATGLEPGRHSFRIAVRSSDGTTTYSNEIEASVETRSAYEIGDVFPNPVRTEASLSFSVREAQAVTIDLYNLLGQRVQTLFAEDVAGNQSQVVRLDGTNLSNGTYLVRLQGRDFIETRTIAVNR